ncbi:MAG: GNAT family N-acetyltransferase [Knoellia sp.]
MSNDLTFATLDLDDETETGAARVNGWLEAVMRGFHMGRPNDEFRTKWLAAQRADDAINEGVWEPDHLALGNGVPVATFAHFVKTLNAGAATIPAWMITDVTVAPTHRRRGLMRRLMTENLASAVAAGVPVAVLTASEGAIYQRFGFGAATREARVRVDTSTRFQLRTRPDDGGRVVIVGAERAWPLIAAVSARHHELTRGALGRPHYYELGLRGFDWDDMGEDRRQQVALRLGPDGEPDGFVAYVVKESDNVGEVSVRDIVTTTPIAHLALWQFLADIDLADVVAAPAPVVDSLEHALVDHRVRGVTALSDHLWLRLLDVVAAFEARPWFADDDITIRVIDDLGHADGTFSIDADGGRARVTSTTNSPDVTLDVETLSTLYLGDVPVDALAGAGRIRGSDEAVHRFAGLADGSPSPHCNTHF